MRFSRQFRGFWRLRFWTLSAVSFTVGIGLTPVNALPGVGEKAPAFSLTDFNNKTFSLSTELKNNNAILLWFTNLCEGCQASLPELEKIRNRYEKNRILVIAVSQLGKDRKTVENIIRENKLAMGFLFDPAGKATEQFSGKYQPGTCPLKNIFLIGKDRKIAFISHYPGIDESEITDQLNKMIEIHRN